MVRGSSPPGYLPTSPRPPDTRPSRISPRQGGAVSERRGEASAANAAKADRQTNRGTFFRQPAELLNETQPEGTVGAFLCRSYSTLLANETGVPIDIIKEALVEEGRDESDKPKVLSAAQRIFSSRHGGWGEASVPASVANEKSRRRSSLSPRQAAHYLTISNEVQDLHEPKPPERSRSRSSIRWSTLHNTGERPASCCCANPTSQSIFSASCYAKHKDSIQPSFPFRS